MNEEDLDLWFEVEEAKEGKAITANWINEVGHVTMFKLFNIALKAKIR